MPALRQDAPDQGQQASDVVPGGELGHHPAIDPVKLDLTENLMTEQAPVGVQNRRGALIARGFNCQNSHVALESCAPVPMGALLGAGTYSLVDQ